MNVLGKLIGRNSAPVAGVKVQVLDGQSIISTSAPSAADGSFSCTVTEQWYDRPLTLLIHAPGYLPIQPELKVQEGGGPYEFKFELTPSVPPPPDPPPPPPNPPKGWWPPPLDITLKVVFGIAFIGAMIAVYRHERHGSDWRDFEWPSVICITLGVIYAFRKTLTPLVLACWNMIKQRKP